MKHDPFKLSLLMLTAGVLTYVASYVAIRIVRPECINTNDGPIAAYTTLYYPLRYLESEKPAWYSKTHDGWLEARIDEINLGNGYLYFSWDGGEASVFLGDDLDEYNMRDFARVHFHYELETRDDFRSRLVPMIDQVKRQPRHSH